MTHTSIDLAMFPYTSHTLELGHTPEAKTVCSCIDLTAIESRGSETASAVINELIEQSECLAYFITRSQAVPPEASRFLAIVIGDNPVELVSCGEPLGLLCISRRGWRAIGGFPSSYSIQDPKHSFFAETVNLAAHYRVFQTLDLTRAPEVVPQTLRTPSGADSRAE